MTDAGGGARRLRPPPRVLRGFLPCCVSSCRVASRGVFRLEWRGRCAAGWAFPAVLRRGRILPPGETQDTPAQVIPRVKPTPPLRAHNTTIQANFGTQGRCRFHLLEPQGTQGRCRFRTFPRVPSYGCVPANLPWSRRHAASCRSALLGRGTTVAPLTCSRQPRPTGFRHLRGQEPHRHGPDRRARRGVQRRIG